MVISRNARSDILNLLVNMVEGKVRKYKRETTAAPFHERLFGSDRYESFSFVQSLNTSLGMSIWEQIAVVIANDSGAYAERQYRLGGLINQEADDYIKSYIKNLLNNRISANKDDETRVIRQIIAPGAVKYPNEVVDLFVRFGEQEEYIDMTSAKPNRKEFQALKEKLLYWTSMRLSSDPNAIVITRLGIPYNPYEPEPYFRWTGTDFFDLSAGEILVGRDFWNHIGQDNIYDELLDIFEEAGKHTRESLGKHGY